MSKFVVVDGDFRLCVANFEGGKGKKKELVPFLKPCDDTGKELAFAKGFSPAKLKAMLTSPNRDALIALCDEAIAIADRANGAIVNAAPAAPAKMYYVTTGKGDSVPATEHEVRAFVLANKDNPAAHIHDGTAWHAKDAWGALGFALPPAPPAAPAAPAVATAPAAPPAPNAEPAAPRRGLEAVIAKKQLQTA